MHLPRPPIVNEPVVVSLQTLLAHYIPLSSTRHRPGLCVLRVNLLVEKGPLADHRRDAFLEP